MFNYLHDPAEIYRRSFAQVRCETNLDRLPDNLHDLAIRLVHACGMPNIVTDLVCAGDPATAGQVALAAGATILTDANMVSAGIIRDRLPKANPIICRVAEAAAAENAEAGGTTRSAAAVDLWGGDLGGAVVAIGNAPTALFRLLEILMDGAPKPAAIFAFPVGFVGAVESKEALIVHAAGVPFVTLRGRRGGSAIAAAAVNALAGSALGGPS